MRRNDPPRELSAPAERVIADGLRRDENDTKIQREIRRRLGESVTRDEIAYRRDVYRRTVEAKQYLKRKGADLVSEFLEKAMGGGDISELQTVLSNAVYLDMLRRYAAEEEPLDGIGMKDLLKLTNDYERIRLASRRADGKGAKGLPVARALEFVELIGAAVSADPAAEKAAGPLREKLAEAVRSCYGAEEIEEARAEQELLQEITEKFERGGGVNE